jgi:hypothetical protein
MENLVWVRSSFSFANGNCVEIARLPGGCVGIRDSKHPEGAMLAVTPDAWEAFIAGARNAEFG